MSYESLNKEASRSCTHGATRVPNPACRLDKNPVVGLEAKRSWGPPQQTGAHYGARGIVE
jgi:hypothetical protein